MILNNLFNLINCSLQIKNKMKTPYIIIYLIERSLYFVRRVQRNLKFLLSEKLK